MIRLAMIRLDLTDRINGGYIASVSNSALHLGRRIG